MPPDVALPFIVIMTLVLGGFGVLIARGPIGRALSRRIEGPHGQSDELVARLVELEQRLAESELDRHRIAELEERLDFAERLLTAGNAEPPRELP